MADEKFDAIVLGVAHDKFTNIDFASIKKDNAVIYDVKGILGVVADGKL